MPGPLQSEVQKIMLGGLNNSPWGNATFEAALTPTQSWKLEAKNPLESFTAHFVAGIAAAVDRLAQELDEKASGE